MTFSADHPDFCASLSDVSSMDSGSSSSCQSRETATTEYTGSPISQHLRKAFAENTPPSPSARSDKLSLRRQKAHASAASIPSTISSEEDLVEDVPDHIVPVERPQQYWTDAVPASSADYAELFPSSRLLSIRHDDSTLDGNMNLRVDTRATTPDGERLTITLFHLRMKDLKTREFSLRRYCRDSGREICHSLRKPQRSIVAHSKPHFRRSLSTVLHGFRHKADHEQPKQHRASMILKRSDSGYDSTTSDFDDGLNVETPQHPKSSEPASSDFISLSFSNYAHLDLKRKGIKADKKYEFEYWGEEYHWQRVTQHGEHSRSSYSYHLMRKSDSQIVAHIIPMSLTAAQETDEAEMGGWVYPCTMRITDLKLLEASADVAEAVVATGLTTLLDDSIRRHFHPQETKQLVIPMPKHSSLMVNMDYVDPKRLIDEAFGRHGPHHHHHHHHQQSRPSSA